MKRLTGQNPPALNAVRALWPVLGAVLFFLAICLSSAATIGSTAAQLILLVLASAFLFWERLRDRLKPPILALALVLFMDAVSCFYAVARKFALYELVKVISSFCLVLLFLVVIGKDRPERKAAAAMEGAAAIAGLVSIDLLSTRWVSTPVLTVLSWFTPDYQQLNVVEEGVRMTSLFIYPNAFACCMAIGVLLGLGLAVTAEKPAARAVHLVCLSVNSLAFLLTFSLGGCAAILPAFLVFLLLSAKERRIKLFLLMLETLIITALCAFPISQTALTAWDGVRPIPLLCTVGGAAALCAVDLLGGQRLAKKLEGHGKAMLILVAGFLVGLVVFVIAACNLTTGVTLQDGANLRRSAYPKPGDYTVTAEADDAVNVLIQSQNHEDTMQHTYSDLYWGPLSQAAFTVPEDSQVVWFQFDANGETRIETVEYSGENGSGDIPLKYRLLPEHIANRLQGLPTNQNAIQRFSIFEDGLKLFRRSPIIGLGLGAFGSSTQGVQTFYFYTKYTHNHYIQSLAETGVIGFVLFLGLLIVSAVCIWRGRKRVMAPALGAVLVFLVCHSALDFIFSQYASLTMAFCAFAVISLCCGDDFPQPAWVQSKRVQNGVALGICAMLAVLWGLLGCNAAARNMVSQSRDLDTLERAAALDPFERADYMLTYVVLATGTEPDAEVQQKADEYAARLGQIDSNSIPIYLAEYYLASGRVAQGMEQAERYVTYVASDMMAWQKTFELLERYEEDTPEYREKVLHIADLLDTWNEENLGHIELEGQARAFVERMRG